MPTYKNQNAQKSLLVIEGESFPYGENVETDHYIDHPDLVFVSHTPKKDRVKKLYIGVIPAEALTGLEYWDEMVVYNKTGAAITLVLNEDSVNAIDVPNDDRWIFTLHRRYYKIGISGNGAGNVMVYLFR